MKLIPEEEEGVLPFEQAQIEGLTYAVSGQEDNQFFPAIKNELLFYAFVRDIHYTDGF